MGGWAKGDWIGSIFGGLFELLGKLIGTAIVWVFQDYLHMMVGLVLMIAGFVLFSHLRKRNRRKPGVWN